MATTPQPDFPGDARSAPIHRFAHRAMACEFEIGIAGQEPAYARDAADAAFAECDRLEGELSRFVATSDISRINSCPPGQSVCVGMAAIECLEMAGRVWRDTAGAFDVTVGALLSHRAALTLPSPEVPGEGSEGVRVGMDLLEVDRMERLVGWKAAGAKIDLGAIGKGYTLDCMAGFLRDWSITSALLHSGQSSVLAIGAPPGANAWRVGVRDPRDQSRVLGAMTVRDRALSGSGMLLHGKHIFDPRTGRPAEGKIGTWAMAGSAALSDALSTAFMVMAMDDIEKYCAAHPEVSGMVMGDDGAVRKLGEFAKLASGV